ncbi:VIT1/CCC1 transporter family protein [Halobacteriaceae archaeon GCM10025711]
MTVVPSLASLRRQLAKESVRSISRRYFISNGFDGTLTSIGVVVGAFLSGVPDGVTVVKIGLGAAVGLATSGVWSVWEIERAEKLAEIQDLERSMLTDLDDTQVMREKQHARVINAVMSGLGPLIGILLPLVPFLFEGAFLSMLEATAIAVAIGVSVLFTFGAYMGSISKQRWYVAGVRMGLAGLVVAAINVLLPG